jgi:DNA-binding IclR family transcriptional regulator
MDAFNRIWQAVKIHCNHAENIDTNCVEVIAEKARIRKDKLDLFLHTLQDLGLISFSRDTMHIRLTESGKAHGKYIC